MSPTELFDYRLAALLGYADVDLMKHLMPYRVYLGWQKYWEEEPWGPWRDNFHIAILAREIHRGGNLKRYFYTNANRKLKEETQGFMASLGAMATKVTPKEARKRLKAGAQQRRNRKKRK